MKLLSTIILALFVCQVSYGQADTPDSIEYLQHQWAIANYKTPETKLASVFENLISQANVAVETHPDDARYYIWQGIITSTYAGKAGGLSALGLVKASRKSLEKAIAINDTAMKGSAYTSLGALYYQVPGWPIAFGNNKKARKYLEKAIAIDPDGIDSNYFYGAFLADQKEYAGARKALQHALKAAPRPDRPLADEGRRSDISKLLNEIKT